VAALAVLWLGTAAAILAADLLVLRLNPPDPLARGTPTVPDRFHSAYRMLQRGPGQTILFGPWTPRFTWLRIGHFLPQLLGVILPCAFVGAAVAAWLARRSRLGASWWCGAVAIVPAWLLAGDLLVDGIPGEAIFKFAAVPALVAAAGALLALIWPRVRERTPASVRLDALLAGCLVGWAIAWGGSLALERAPLDAGSSHHLMVARTVMPLAGLLATLAACLLARWRGATPGLWCALAAAPAILAAVDRARYFPTAQWLSLAGGLLGVAVALAAGRLLHRASVHGERRRAREARAH